VRKIKKRGATMGEQPPDLPYSKKRRDYEKKENDRRGKKGIGRKR
jgi:hypothetical protein